MNSRERVIAALNHTEPDRIPFGLGGTVVNGIHIRAYQALRKYLNLPEVKPGIVDIFQQIVQVDDDLMAILGVDSYSTLHITSRRTSLLLISWQCGRPFKSSAYITDRSWFLGCRLDGEKAIR